MGRAARARRPPEIHAADAPCAPAPRDAPPARSPGAGEARLALLSAAVRSSPGPVVVTDALDRVVAASEGLLRAIGREESDVRGEPFASLIAREEGAPRAGTRLREAERGGWQGDLLFRGGGSGAGARARGGTGGAEPGGGRPGVRHPGPGVRRP
ncbi:PAS domain-containing protein [Myxococcota bacterium]|nr:PAS domain-containing protein [Myxococcota bacterium]